MRSRGDDDLSDGRGRGGLWKEGSRKSSWRRSLLSYVPKDE